MVALHTYWKLAMNCFGCSGTRRALSLAAVILFFVLPAWPQNAGEYSHRADSLYREALKLNSSSLKEDRLSGISKMDEAISLYLRDGRKDKAAELYNIQGTTWMTLGDYVQRINAYEKALELIRATGDVNGEGLALMNIGFSHSEAGENDRALKYLEQAAAKFTAASNKYYESMVYWSIAGIHDRLGMPEKALGFYLLAERVSGSAQHILAIADILDRLGRHREAFKYYKGLEYSQRRRLDGYGLSNTYRAMGIHFMRQKKFNTSVQYLRRSLQELARMKESHSVRSSAASTLAILGDVYSRMGNGPSAIRMLLQSRDEFARMGDREAEANVSMSLGNRYIETSEFEKARTFFAQAAALYRLSGNRPREAEVFNSLQILFRMSGNSRLAVSFGKKAVNEFQALRSEIKGMSKDARSSYLKKVESAYRDLADLLVEEGRLAEAQEVLAMLKEEEVFDFVRRDASDIDKLNKRADLREDERKALEGFDSIAGRIAAVGEEFGKLKEKQAGLADGQKLSADEQKRLDDLGSELEQVNRVFQVFLRELSDEFANKSKVIEDIQENAGLQADLRSWGTGVVSIYTIAGGDRYRVILTTPETQIDGKSEIKGADLNKKVAAFRTAVQDPRMDPRPLGKELYDILIKPIEGQLAGAQAKTLLWSLDGSLRYLPIAALWDGKQYFGQKYQNVVMTLASRTRLSDPPSKDWRMLGLGVTAAKQLTEPNGSRTIKFSALPAVRSELSTIVREEQSPDDQGVIAGRSLFDEEFTEKSLKERLSQRFKVIHIASHFSFRPGDMTRSFLLLGDGTALTMDKFKTSPQLKFTGVDLLTLSACDTAVSEPDADGKEVESFAVIAQQNGAKAVLATLWPVADQSTAAFMAEFYKLKDGKADISKAEAIRQVQKAMIDGRMRAIGGPGGCRAENFGSTAKPAGFKCDPSAPFSHPYFWSPFVLIGNWR
jgi:CHAT domain-containing protein/tetratricopeptide (TPR) repeat protein